VSRFYGKKVDENHKVIREDFRKAGWLWCDLHRLGGGVPDGMVLSPNHLIYLIEVKRLDGKKNPKASTNAKAATKKAQSDFAANWPVVVLTSIEDAQEFRYVMLGRFRP
jgi:hypothetical protein